MSALKMWQATFTMMVLPLCSPNAFCDDIRSAAIEEIQDAWRKRKHEVGGFEYQFKVVESEFVPLKFAYSDDPFDDRRDRLRGKVSERIVEMDQQMTYKSAGEKWNVTIVGDELEHSTFKPHSFQLEDTSDGYTNRLKYQTSQHCYGIMAKRGVAGFGGECPGNIANHARPAVSIWAMPASYIAQQRGELSTLKVASNDTRGIEAECLELSMDRIALISGKRQEIGLIRLQVERERPYFVRRAEIYLGDGLRSTTCIAYVDDKSGDRIVSEWSHTTYDERGLEGRTRFARLTRYQRNCHFNEDDFSPKYPVGTIVEEFTADLRGRPIQWRQGKDGVLARVDNVAHVPPK
ncbi:hypothetical protein [Lacipirellula limnantheis]|uniref:Uncharacterized protein n=1 Tax=Lacipirellula limnantheis TaxID=2528024 RepID=A0A517U6H7_9BACT|nr:hypothetical protein [Lacipirellula limnantheis]QDT76239.1 hypothetical protein I41_54890 [Lacipirellula limnantheis]